MKGHVFMADGAALQMADKVGMHAVFAEDAGKPQWRKTRADMLADLACLRPGDRIFFYNKNTTAFHGIYEVVSELFEDNTDLGWAGDAPYRIKLHRFLPLPKALPENRLFTRKNAARDFRSIFFKKVLQRGKACTHLFPDETAALTEVMLMQNDDAEAVRNKNSAGKVTPLVPEFKTAGGECSLEKELEWWLTHNIDRHPECAKIFGAPQSIEMFANYVPIDIAGGNIDLVVYHCVDSAGISVRNKISIVELKKGLANKDALDELEKYARSFIQNVTGLEGADAIQPVIIANRFTGELVNACKYWNLCARKPRLFRYTATSTRDIQFAGVHYE